MRSFLIASLFVLSAVASAEDVGILLGLGSPGGTGSTLWISQQGVATFAQRAGAGYWLWKDDGFWHVLDEERKGLGRTATVTVTSPAGKVTAFLGRERNTNFVVEYVAPRAFGLRAWPGFAGIESFGGTGVHASGGILGRWINQRWSDISEIVRVRQALGEEMAKAFEKAAADAERPYSNYNSDYYPEHWTLRRDQGAWMLQGEGFHAPGEFTVGEISEPKMGAYAGRRPTWSQIRRKYADAIDYTTSPDGTLTVIVTPNETFVHRSNGTSLQRLLRRVRVTADRIVMTQWLEGEEVRKVGEAVSKIKR